MSKDNKNGKIFIYIFPLFLVLYQTQCINTKALQLLSNNIVYVNKTGIYLYDNNLDFKSIIKIFNESYSISSNDLSYTSLSQYSTSYDEIIICKIKNYIFLFPEDSSFMCEDTINENLENINNVIVSYNKIQENSNQNFYFFFCYISGSNSPLNITEYYFKKNSNSCTLNEKISKSYKTICSEGYSIGFYAYLDCHLMYENILACFHINANPSEFSVTLLDPENNLEESNTNYPISSTDNRSGKLKSAISNDKKSALICISCGSGEIYCTIYSLEKKEFSAGCGESCL